MNKRSMSVQKRRYKVKEMAIAYRGGKCEKCGYNKCNGALEFHHLDPSKKDFAIGNKGYTRSWEKIREELDKCIMLCANCHRELHWEAQAAKRQEIMSISKRMAIFEHCFTCGKITKNKKYCSKKCTRKTVIRPSYEQLKQDLAESNYCAVGRKYGVSDNAIRKWIRYYER